MVLSNGDPVTFARIKSKEEADNLGAWINHLLGVQVEKEEEVKVKEIVEDILNESFDLLEEAAEEENDEANDSGLLDELCPEEEEEGDLVLVLEEEEEEDLVLADVEETVDFFEMEVRGLLKKHYPDEVEEISKSVDEPIENEEVVDELEEDMFKEISYVSFDMPIVDEFCYDQEVSLEVEEIAETDECEYLPGTLEITGEMPETKDEDMKVAEEEDLTENASEEVELTESEWFDMVSETTFDHESLEKPKEVELSEIEWFELISETEHDSGSLLETTKYEDVLEEELKKQTEAEELKDELEFELEGDLTKEAPNMPAFVQDEIVRELNKVEWLQLVSKDVNEDEPLEEQSEDEDEEVLEAEMTEEEWFDLVGETYGCDVGQSDTEGASDG